MRNSTLPQTQTLTLSSYNFELVDHLKYFVSKVIKKPIVFRKQGIAFKWAIKPLHCSIKLLYLIYWESSHARYGNRLKSINNLYNWCTSCLPPRTLIEVQHQSVITCNVSYSIQFNFVYSNQNKISFVKIKTKLNHAIKHQ